MPQALREGAQISGEVTVIGKNDHLEVWNSERIIESMKDDPMTDADREQLEKYGL